MLKIENLHAYYGTIEALKGISLEIRTGEITCLVGSNGAGKTTLLKSISGATNCTGSIQDEGWPGALGLSPQKMAHRHIIHVPEGRHIFPGLTVRDNLEVGTINWHGFWGRKPYDAELEEVFTLFPRLKEREKQLGWSLSGGEQQMLAIGRALMAHPRVLMLDEPSMGLAPVIVSELFEKIQQINRQGMTIPSGGAECQASHERFPLYVCSGAGNHSHLWSFCRCTGRTRESLRPTWAALP